MFKPVNKVSYKEAVEMLTAYEKDFGYEMIGEPISCKVVDLSQLQIPNIEIAVTSINVHSQHVTITKANGEIVQYTVDNSRDYITFALFKNAEAELEDEPGSCTFIRGFNTAHTACDAGCLKETTNDCEAYSIRLWCNEILQELAENDVYINEKDGFGYQLPDFVEVMRKIW